MKRATLCIALTLGLVAPGVPAQSQGDASRQLIRAPQARAERDREKGIRPPGRRSLDDRHRPVVAQPRHGPPASRPLPRGFAGPPPHFEPGRPSGPPPQGPGPAWHVPPHRATRREVCPFCHQPMAQQFTPRGRRGDGPRFAPPPHFAPRARGPAFGPPLWDDPSRPDAKLRPGQRAAGHRPPPPPDEPRFAPGHRPAGPERRFDRPGPGPAPADRDAPNRPARGRD